MSEKYFLGLDIGTDSVGYAVTDEQYNLAKYNNLLMWGSHIFDGGSTAAERRKVRTARRRLQRRQQRVRWVKELFAKEIERVDSRFFIRLQESALIRDKNNNEYSFPVSRDSHILFNEGKYTDKDFYKKYPTIHHLISAQLNGDEDALKDIRLLYISCAWFVAHRGHFLSQVNKENINNVLDFSVLYERFNNFLVDNEKCFPTLWDIKNLEEVLKKKLGITKKYKLFCETFYGGCKKVKSDENSSFDIDSIIKLLCGAKVALSQVFKNDDYKQLESDDKVSLESDDEVLMDCLSKINDEDSEFILILKAMYDWSILTSLLDGNGYISNAKVIQYSRHKEDLRELKDIVIKYGTRNHYISIFKKINNIDEKEKNKIKNKDSDNEKIDKKTIKNSKYDEYIKTNNLDDFGKAIKKILDEIKEISGEKIPEGIIEKINEKIDSGTYFPIQVNSNNRVIPYQLYWVEMRDLLNKASNYHKFLLEKEDGISIIDKLLSIMEFRVPYFVGPLVSCEKSKYAWMRKIGDGKIYPWNFSEKVDLELSEKEFINRLINHCSYLPEEKVLPKGSLVYSKFEVLNEINNIRVNGEKITVECKQHIYNELFMKNDKVSYKQLNNCISSFCNVNKEDVHISGIDETIKSNLKSYRVFKRLLSDNVLNIKDVEKIIECSTYTEDSLRFELWLKREFPKLSKEDVKYLKNKKFKDFGRLSKKLLCDLKTRDGNNNEVSILELMWETNDNFMQIVESDKYDFKDQVVNARKDYYSEKNFGLNERLDDLYISNSVKRIIYRTFDVVSDVVKAKGCAPTKIFIEVARDVGDASKKGVRTKSRKVQIEELYKNIETEVLPCLNDLGDDIDRKLQSKKIFLYFLQLGKCAYSGERIDINELLIKDSKKYDVDHIYPQSIVKDDSLDNKVLCLSCKNSDKADKYPINIEWIKKMKPFWDKLRENGLMSERKYQRLIRENPLTDEEKWDFINRQLVETRQSTKVIAELLQEKYTDARIVYVKSSIVSDFREEVLETVKARSINDLHHAKDAYLNICVGNVYDEKYTKLWWNENKEKYNVKNKKLFEELQSNRSGVFWYGGNSINLVRKTHRINAIQLTRFSKIDKGAFFDLMPCSKKEGLYRRKKDLPTEIYGGYKSTTIACYILVGYTKNGCRDALFMPIEKLCIDKFVSDESFANEYILRVVKEIAGDDVNDSRVLLNKRILKINSIIELDGTQYCISAKSNRGKSIILKLNTSNIFDEENEKVIKAIDRYVEKKVKYGEAYIYNKDYDDFTLEDLDGLYLKILNKYKEKPFDKMPGNPRKLLEQKEEKFMSLSLDDKVKIIVQLVSSLKTGRTGSCNLSLIEGKPKTINVVISSMFRNLMKNYSSLKIVDVSASGMFIKKTENLFDLI